MWWLCVAIPLVAMFLAIEFGFVPPPWAIVLVRIRKGMVTVRRGAVLAHARTSLAEILQETDVSEGFIAITSGKRVTFSRHIPERIRQRLRNVLLNQ